MIAAAGSPVGTRGIVTRPAPRRPRLLAERADPVRDERVDAVRADRAEPGWVTALCADGAGALAETPAMAAVGMGASIVGAAGDPGAGALPHTSQ